MPRKHKNIIIFYYLPFTFEGAKSSLYEIIIRLCPLIDFFQHYAHTNIFCDIFFHLLI